MEYARTYAQDPLMNINAGTINLNQLSVDLSVSLEQRIFTIT